MKCTLILLLAIVAMAVVAGCAKVETDSVSYELTADELEAQAGEIADGSGISIQESRSLVGATTEAEADAPKLPPRPTPPPRPPCIWSWKCVDYDGDNPFKKGGVTLTFSCGTTISQTIPKDDTCLNGEVTEYVCVKNKIGDSLGTKKYACPSNPDKIDMCDSEKAKCLCYDSDGGKNPLVPGTTTGSNGIWTDQCFTNANTILMEYYCDRGGVVMPVFPKPVCTCINTPTGAKCAS